MDEWKTVAKQILVKYYILYIKKEKRKSQRKYELVKKMSFVKSAILNRDHMALGTFKRSYRLKKKIDKLKNVRRVPSSMTVKYEKWCEAMKRLLLILVASLISTPRVGGQWDDITDKLVVFDQVYYPGCKLPS